VRAQSESVKVFATGHPSRVHLSSTLLVWVATLYSIIALLTDLHFHSPLYTVNC
jgi:hypothetical protein